MRTSKTWPASEKETAHRRPDDHLCAVADRSPADRRLLGKFYISEAALESHLVWLTVLGLLNRAVGASSYLQILVTMYMREPGEGALNAKPFRHSACGWH